MPLSSIREQVRGVRHRGHRRGRCTRDVSKRGRSGGRARHPLDRLCRGLRHHDAGGTISYGLLQIDHTPIDAKANRIARFAGVREARSRVVSDSPTAGAYTAPLKVGAALWTGLRECVRANHRHDVARTPIAAAVTSLPQVGRGLLRVLLVANVEPASVGYLGSARGPCVVERSRSEASRHQTTGRRENHRPRFAKAVGEQSRQVAKSTCRETRADAPGNDAPLP